MNITTVVEKNFNPSIQNVIVTGKSGAGKQPRINVLKNAFHLEQLSMGDIFRHYVHIFETFQYPSDLDEFFEPRTKEFVADEIISKKIQTNNPDIILGLKAKYVVEHGLFGPDKIVNELFHASFKEKQFNKQILDGYPRTLNQAEYLIQLMKTENIPINFILLVDNTDERILNRTINRRICPNCGKVYHLQYKPPVDGKCEICGVPVIQRSDDTKDRLQNRLQEFQNKTIPALKYLTRHHIPLITVSGHLDTFTEETVRKSVLSTIQNELYEKTSSFKNLE